MWHCMHIHVQYTVHAILFCLISFSLSVFNEKHYFYDIPLLLLCFTILRHSKLNATFFSFIFSTYSLIVDSSIFQQFGCSCVNDTIFLTKKSAFTALKLYYSLYLFHSSLIAIYSLEFIPFRMNGAKDPCNLKMRMKQWM